MTSSSMSSSSFNRYNMVDCHCRRRRRRIYHLRSSSYYYITLCYLLFLWNTILLISFSFAWIPTTTHQRISIILTPTSRMKTIPKKRYNSIDYYYNRRLSSSISNLKTTPTTKRKLMLQSREYDNHNNNNDVLKHHPSRDNSNNNSNNNENDNNNHKIPCNVLIVDHYDSFTYNLVDYIGQICNQTPTVITADCVNHYEELSSYIGINNMNQYDCIILSPGPGNPSSSSSNAANNHDNNNNKKIFQLSRSIIENNPSIPILGVCLGHQIMGDYYGADVALSPQPIHGQIHTIQTVTNSTNNNSNSNHHVDDILFYNIPNQLNVTRYHSLQVLLHNNESLLSSCLLIPTSYCINDNVLMSMKHIYYPHYGVQFHPESIGSIPYGMILLQNFILYSNQYKQDKQQSKQNEQKQYDETNANAVNIPLSSPSPSSFRQQYHSSNDNNNNIIINNDDEITSSSCTTSTNSDKEKTHHHPNDNNGKHDLLQLPVFNVYIHKISRTKTNSLSSMISPSQVMDEFMIKSQYSFWLDGEMSSLNNIKKSVNENKNEMTKPTSLNDTTTTTTSSSTMYQSKISILGGQYKKNDDDEYTMRRIEYWGKEKPMEVQGLYIYENNVCAKHDDDDILSYLEHYHSHTTSNFTLVTFDDNNDDDDDDEEKNTRYNLHTMNEDDEQSTSQIPFQYRGGHVGFLGYEVRHNTAHYQAMMEGNDENNSKINNHDDNSLQNNKVPTAAFLWADRSFVYHHDTSTWYIVGVHTQNENSIKDKRELQNMLNWMQKSSNTIQKNYEKRMRIDEKMNVIKMNNNVKIYQSSSNKRPSLSNKVAFIPQRSKDTYMNNFYDCIEYIRQGESYELCLTNQIHATVITKNKLLRDPILSTTSNRRSSPLQLYHILRRRNPAPYSSFIDWNSIKNNHFIQSLSSSNDDNDTSFAICCSSPERFVSVKRRKRLSNGEGKSSSDDGSITEIIQYEVEAKPIKGTASRVIPKSVRAAATDREHGNNVDTYTSQSYSSSSSSFQQHLKHHQYSHDWTDEEWIEDQSRALELQLSIKNRAENLMIVDLLRNDLSRVCDVGSVYVAKLFGIESFATVHQLVSTIRGTITQKQQHNDLLSINNNNITETSSIRSDTSSSLTPSIQVLKALFPGGSMTGAPKIRTMELLDTLEERKCRGPYSGCLGYISVNGCMDMNIIIRTAVLIPEHTTSYDNNNEMTTHWNVNIGTGGAITALSENEDEYDEMIVKANPVMKAVEEWATTMDTEYDAMISKASQVMRAAEEWEAALDEPNHDIGTIRNNDAPSFLNSKHSFVNICKSSAVSNTTVVVK